MSEDTMRDADADDPIDITQQLDGLERLLAGTPDVMDISIARATVTALRRALTPPMLPSAPAPAEDHRRRGH